MIKLDKRTTKDLFIEMKERLQKYDKRYDFGEGSQLYALFMLYSEMLFQCIRHYNMSPNTHKKTFLDIFNLSPIRAKAAEAQLGFIRADGYDEPITIPKGTEVYANKDKEIGFRTLSDSLSMFDCAPAEVHLYCDPGAGKTYFDVFVENIFWKTKDDDHTFELFTNIYNHGVESLKPIFFDAAYFTWKLIIESGSGELEYDMEVITLDMFSVKFKINNFNKNVGSGKIRFTYKKDIYDYPSSDIIIKSFRLRTKRRSTLIYHPLHIIIDNQIMPNTENFFPFGMPFNDFSSVYIDIANVLKPFKTISCMFNIEYISGSETAANLAYASNITFDYWDGNNYKPILSSASPLPDKFKESSYTISFYIPEDIALIKIGDITSYFFRINSGFCPERYQPSHKIMTPHITRFSLTTDIRVTCISKVFTNYLGGYKELKFAKYSPDISGYWLFPYQLGREELLVGFDSLPAAGEHLYTYVKVKREGLDSGVLKICHLGSNTQLNTADSTDNLRKSGELSFVPLAGAKKETLYGKEAYWFKFGGNKNCDVTNFTIYPYYTKAHNIYKSEAIYYLADLDDAAVNLPHKQLIKVNVYVFEREEWWEWKEAEPKDIVLKYGSYKVDYEKGIVYFPSPITAYAYEDEAIKISYEACDGVYANLPDDSVNRLDEEIPNIVGVRSIISRAGVDAETHSMRRQRTLNFLHDLNNPIPAAKREGDCIEDPPDLERMEYSSMIRQAMLRIPALCPEWTDHNPQDTGIMLLELCAAYCEMLGYYADNMGDRFLYQYLELLTGDKREKYESLLSFIIALSDLVHGTSRAVTADDYKTVLKLLKQPELTGIDTEVKGFDVSLKLKKGKDEPLSEEEKNIVRNYLEDYRQLCSVITFI